MMAGQAFPDLMRPQNMRWDAGILHFILKFPLIFWVIFWS